MAAPPCEKTRLERKQSMTRILIVEDDAHIAKMIATALAIGDYEGVICRDGAEAVDMILAGGFDLILLDIMLPSMDGFEVFERTNQREIPVIFLTAMGDVSSKVKGLHLGAEDYIVKPFEAMELLARIEVVLRRSGKGKTTLTYRDICVALGEHTVLKGGEPVNLTPKEFDVLVFFLQNQDLAVTRQRLLSAVWNFDFQGESRTVDIHVQQVRRKMGLQDCLVTIPKLGYRLESEPR